MKINSILLAAVAFCLTGFAGTITVDGLWHLGESDPGAVSGNAANSTTLDSSGFGDTLSVVGGTGFTNPTYTNLAAPGSTLAMIFNGSSGYSGAAVTATGLNNWGIEIWAKTSTNTGNHAVIYDGNSGNAGFGIYQVGGNWDLLYGGVILQSGPAVTLNQWTDLALVRDGGSATLYVNGAATSLTTGTPNAISGNLLIGTRQGGAAEGFIGSLDEGRIFTVNNGFNTASLYINSTPEPGTLGLAAGSLLGLGLLLRRRARA